MFNKNSLLSQAMSASEYHCTLIIKFITIQQSKTYKKFFELNHKTT